MSRSGHLMQCRTYFSDVCFVSLLYEFLIDLIGISELVSNASNEPLSSLLEPIAARLSACLMVLELRLMAFSV